MIKTERKLTLELLKKIPVVKPPEAGGSWYGLPHAETIETLMKTCADLGYPLKLRNIVLSENYQEMAADFDIVDKILKLDRITVNRQLGIHTSNDRRHSMKLYTGVENSNLSLVLNEVAVGRKRSVGFDLRVRFEMALYDCFSMFTGYLQPELLRWSRHKVLPHTADLMDIANHGIVPWSRIPAIRDRVPLDSKLTLLASLSHVIERTTPLTQMRKKLAATRWMRRS